MNVRQFYLAYSAQTQTRQVINPIEMGNFTIRVSGPLTADILENAKKSLAKELSNRTGNIFHPHGVMITACIPLEHV